MLGSIFNVASTRDAFAHLLTGRETLDSILVPAPHQPRLELLPANRGRLYSLQQYGSDALPEAIAKLSSRADVVIIDSPPLPEVAEALSLAASVEAVLISVRLGHTRREKLERLRELLDSRGLAPLGFVVTTRQRPEASYSQYYYPAEPPNMRMTEGEDAAARILRSTDR
jgi:receptor protein-tyrosine kinase